MNPTLHSMQRAIQGAIPAEVIAAVYDYGSPSHHRGALALRLDREALDLAQDDLPPRLGRRLGRYRGIYAIASGANVVTVARPVRRHRT